MPFYDYKCECCGRQINDVRVLTYDEGVWCPSCGAEMTRQPAAASFTISGFSTKNNYGLKKEGK